jgi:hypothetical protein
MVPMLPLWCRSVWSRKTVTGVGAADVQAEAHSQQKKKRGTKQNIWNWTGDFRHDPLRQIQIESRVNATELIRLRAKFVDFGVYLRSNFDAGTAELAITIGSLEATSAEDRYAGRRWKRLGSRGVADHWEVANPENWMVSDGKLYVFGSPAPGGPALFQKDLAGNIRKANANRSMLPKI